MIDGAKSKPKRTTGATSARQLTDVKIGRLTILHPVPNDTGKPSTGRRWKWRCDCGREGVMPAKEAKAKQARGHAGCMQCEYNSRLLPIGFRSANWTVVGTVRPVGRKKKYECVCDCGARRLLIRPELRGQPHCARCRAGLQSVPTAIHVVTGYRKQAEKRGISWELTEEQCISLFAGNCHYCGLRDVNVRKSLSKSMPDFEYVGIDRVDNSRGYVIDNVVSCCATCNSMKMTASIQDFIDRCALIAQRHCA